MLRRLAGCFTALCVLHLGVFAAETACATQAAGGTIGTAAMATMPDGQAMAGGMRETAPHAAHTPHQHRSCDTHPSRSCCDALGSCAPLFAVDAPRSAAQPDVSARVDASTVANRGLQAAAPETPPPRA